MQTSYGRYGLRENIVPTNLHSMSKTEGGCTSTEDVKLTVRILQLRHYGIWELVSYFLAVFCR